MEWLSLLQPWQQWLSGIGVTMEIMIGSLALGFCLALIVTSARLSHIKLFRVPADVFVFLFRGTPLLVQLFIIYYGSGQFAWIQHSFLWVFLKTPMGCTILALALNTAAYTSELFKGAVLAIPKGQFESCLALGMSKIQAFTRVILPCAIRQAIPAYSNEVIMILKSTTLASTVAIMDLMGITHQIIADTYETIPCLLIAGVLYLILNGAIIGLFRMLEQRFRVLV